MHDFCHLAQGGSWLAKEIRGGIKKGIVDFQYIVITIRMLAFDDAMGGFECDTYIRSDMV